MSARLNPYVARASRENFAPVLKLAFDPEFLMLSAAQHYAPPGEHLVQAVREAAGDLASYRYGWPDGETALLEAIGEKLRTRNGIQADPISEVRVTHGAGHAFLMTLMAFLSPGDEVITADPSFPLNWYASGLFGATVVSCPIDGPGGFEALPDRIAEAVTPRTKAIILHSVNNPTGDVLSRDVAERIAEVAIRGDLLVLSDEVYERFTYDGTSNMSIASVPGMKDRTVSIFGLSKDYNLPGLRVGYLATSAAINGALGLIQWNGPVGASVIGQRAALAALMGPQDGLERLVAELGQTRRRVVDALNQIPGVRCDLPAGGFFVFPDVSAHTDDVEDLYLRLAREVKVGVSSGTWYGSRGAGHIRICYGALSPQQVDVALGRLEAFLRAGARP